MIDQLKANIMLCDPRNCDPYCDKVSPLDIEWIRIGIFSPIKKTKKRTRCMKFSIKGQLKNRSSLE